MRYTIIYESEGERIWKICQYLPKLWARFKRFFTHGVYICILCNAECPTTNQFAV